MRRWLLGCALAVLGCGSDRQAAVITTTGTIEFQDVEGGVWLIRAEDGTLYDPTNLPDTFKVVGARVQVRLVERRDLAHAPQVGIPADILAIEEASCAGVPCGMPWPPVTLHVIDSTSSAAVDGVTLTNLSVPASPPGSGGPSFGCATGPSVTTCFVDAMAPGTYDFDVTAQGYATAHVTVEVPEYPHVPGVCCEPPWVARTVDVALSPVG